MAIPTPTQRPIFLVRTPTTVPNRSPITIPEANFFSFFVLQLILKIIILFQRNILIGLKSILSKHKSK
jgi:hypothetical protein